MDKAFTEASYQALLKDIFNRFPSVQKEGFTAGAYKPGLERMRAFDQALGTPSRQFRSIHVAGTNGKGSVANMLASACSACGLKTGLFTSPHLLDFRERMRIGGALVPKEFVFTFLTQWLPWIEAHQLSFFEITTGMAFQWFAQEKVQLAVIEVGLGGRLDSTNILEHPELTVITSIGLDHMTLLGNTRAQIAAEKAGIFKAGVPALVGERDAQTHPVFDAAARDFCPLTYANTVLPSLWPNKEAILADMDLRASIQERNLRTVLAAVDLLRERFPALEDAQRVWEGIVHTARDMDFHGRWERLSTQPFVLADIGHNAHALQHNFQQLGQMLGSGECSSLILVFGVMADKDLNAILPLMPLDATYIFTSPGTPRALPAQELLRRYKAFRAGEGSLSNVQFCPEGHGIPGPKNRADGPEMPNPSGHENRADGPYPSCPLRAFAAETVREAVQMAVQLAQKLSVQLSRSASADALAPPLIYIGGSSYVVAQALPLFR